MKFFYIFIFMCVCLPVSGRIQVRQTGSSTVYPFAVKVAREFSKKQECICPLVESTSTGNGFIDFASHDGLDYDIVNASRQIKAYELTALKKARVGPILEICIGFDGVVLAVQKGNVGFECLSLKDIFSAISKKITNETGEEIDNTYKKWRDINPKLPDAPIYILIPSKTHGTRDVFDTVVMHGHEVRNGPEVQEISDYESADSHDLLFDFLQHNDHAMAFVALNLLSEHSNEIKALPIDDIEPSHLNIQNGTYLLSRKLFMYVKEKNYSITKGLSDYLNEWLNTKAIGEGGYLTKMGLVPLLTGEKRQRKYNSP